jgi:hypothetical protein
MFWMQKWQPNKVGKEDTTRFQEIQYAYKHISHVCLLELLEQCARLHADLVRLQLLHRKLKYYLRYIIPVPCWTKT